MEKNLISILYKLRGNVHIQEWERNGPDHDPTHKLHLKVGAFIIYLIHQVFLFYYLKFHFYQVTIP